MRGLVQARTRPEPGPNPKINLKPKYCPKKNLEMLPNNFDYIFVHLRQKAHLKPELNPKFLSTLGPSPSQTRP